MVKIYTKRGDKGETSLGGGQRVRKDTLRVQVYGTVDELNSQIGVALATGLCDKLMLALSVIQNELFDLGSDLCFIEEDKTKYSMPQIELAHVTRLETLIDEMSAELEPLKNFILPGGSQGSAQLHVARTVCRRAEREATTLVSQEAIGEQVLTYLNRLSDTLFVMARYQNLQQGVAEPQWRPRV
jgi:cob(I)alamin adenosyltransferase